MTLEWLESPPDPKKPIQARTPRYAGVARQCKEHPNMWTRGIQGVSASVGSQIRRGEYRAFRPPIDWEVRQIRNDEGSYDVYIRYVGKEMEKLGFHYDQPELELTTDKKPERLWPPDLIPDTEPETD